MSISPVHQQNAILHHALHCLQDMYLPHPLLSTDELVLHFREQLFAAAVQLAMEPLVRTHGWTFRAYAHRLQVLIDGPPAAVPPLACERIRDAAWRLLTETRLDHLVAVLDDQ